MDATTAIRMTVLHVEDGLVDGLPKSQSIVESAAESGQAISECENYVKKGKDTDEKASRETVLDAFPSRPIFLIRTHLPEGRQQPARGQQAGELDTLRDVRKIAGVEMERRDVRPGVRQVRERGVVEVEAYRRGERYKCEVGEGEDRAQPT
ncbi:hypothetical protein C8R44DRAFT_726112 [Mycena epipterygia]|nr:hypothetical protein C8R44DRAFT_726112 [Mycena epipterygia]